MASTRTCSAAWVVSRMRDHCALLTRIYTPLPPGPAVQRLRDVLGEEATDDLFAWWQETARVNRGEIREVADLIKWTFIFRAGTALQEYSSDPDIPSILPDQGHRR